MYDLDKKIEKPEVTEARISGKLDILEMNLKNNRLRQVQLNKFLNTKVNLSDDKLKQYKNELLELQKKINELNQSITELNRESRKLLNQ